LGGLGRPTSRLKIEGLYAAALQDRQSRETFKEETPGENEIRLAWLKAGQVPKKMASCQSSTKKKVKPVKYQKNLVYLLLFTPMPAGQQDNNFTFLL
jgi:hypothetical protein